MINFFRKARQRLLVENRFSRYLIYAVGEIALVIIGILIAIQINNFNENSKLIRKEIVLLSEMKRNIQDDLMDLDFNIKGNRNRMQSNQAIKLALQSTDPFHDSLKYHFGNMFGNFQLNENTAAWENLKSVGLDLISNDSLRNSLARLYSTQYKYLENLEKGLDDNYQWNYAYPQLLEHIKLERMWESGAPRNFEELKTDFEFMEVLNMNLTIREYMQNQYEKAESSAKSLVEHIDSHMN